MSTAQIERRLQTLEEEVARLKAELQSRGGTSNGHGWEHLVGTFAGDPLYVEAMRLGREYRQSLRPKARRKRK